MRYNSSSVRISSVSLQDFHLLLLYDEKIQTERLSLDLRRVSQELSLNLDHRLKRFMIYFYNYFKIHVKKV